MNAAPEYGVPPETAAPRRDSVIRTLLRIEWRRHRFGAIAAIGLLLPVMAMTAAVEPAREGIFFWLVFSLAWGTGFGLGRAEWFEGEEEFHLSLPATRAQRYWTKLAFGGAVLLAVYAIGAVTCFTDWFDALHGELDVKRYESGDLPPWIGSGPDFVALALVAPIAAYVECLALSMGVSRRGEIGWVWRLLFVGAGTALVLLAGRQLPEGQAGWLYVPAFLGYALWRARSGASRYAAKDAVLETQTVAGPDRQKAMLLVLLGLLALSGLFAWFLFAYKNSR